MSCEWQRILLYPLLDFHQGSSGMGAIGVTFVMDELNYICSESNMEVMLSWNFSVHWSSVWQTLIPDFQSSKAKGQS